MIRGQYDINKLSQSRLPINSKSFLLTGLMSLISPLMLSDILLAYPVDHYSAGNVMTEWPVQSYLVLLDCHLGDDDLLVDVDGGVLVKTAAARMPDCVSDNVVVPGVLAGHVAHTGALRAEPPLLGHLEAGHPGTVTRQ